MSDEVLYEVEGHVGIITLNRPEKHNAMNPDLIKLLRETFNKANRDRNIRAVVLTGAGDRAFSAGADLIHMATRESSDFGESFWWPDQPRGWAQDFYKPVVAAINGYCYAEVLRGFSGAGPALGLLPRQVPYAKAMEWLMMGKVFGSEEAHLAGLVNEIVPLDQVKTRALEVAKELSKLAPIAVRAIKESVVNGISMDTPNAIKYASTVGVLTRYTKDALEGPRAFAEKREPKYEGR
jgi:enoyl-CoA hydratase/carnithine racemase